MKVNIEESWKGILQDEFDKAYFEKITEFVKSEINAGKTIYPPGKLIFNAFEKTPFYKLKVVMLGQDPYHGTGQAHGLCFSVQRGIKPPPSLINIYKEIQNDLGISPPNHGCLEKWAEQGVFMLNSILTVRANEAASHSKAGWETFTDAVIRKISENKSSVVFLLWGNFARSKKVLIDTQKHFILEAAHPSPLAGNAFLGCKHFSKTNELLEKQGLSPIKWDLKD
ncbi:MAG: uracil-DNA glycosylase [Prevotellaceae bacterium]|jgi:uracil-DNA glycosylase|nr:uracil-DNA glycosylase [Prevotellaceae bacterium]